MSEHIRDMMKKNEKKEEDIIPYELIDYDQCEFIEDKNIKENETLYRQMQRRLKRIISRGKLPRFDLDKFTIEKQIGDGSFGVIYSIYNNKTKKKYAMKKIIANDIDSLELYQKEFEIAHHEKHTSILDIKGTYIKCYDNTTYVLYVLMDLAEKDWEVEINELKDDEEIKKKMYNEMAYQRMEEERKIKEMEIEKKREKNLEEEKRIKEEQKKREEALIQKEKEILKREKDLLKKEKDLERKREEEEKRLIEERRRKEEEEESAEKSRMLKEEEEKLRKEEEEKKKEEKRESDRIKELRIERERKEEEEKKRKQEEKEKKEQMEKLKKEKEILEEKKLKEQINNKKKNNIPVETNNDIDDNEIKIDEINSDDSIEELEEKDFIKQKKQSINKKKSTNLDLNSNNTNQKLKSGNNQNLKSSKFNASVNRFNNMSRNKFQSPTKKSQIKESTNKSIKVQKED